MRTPILALVILLCSVVPRATMAQHVLRGRVIDVRGDLPLVGAHVRSGDGSNGSTTDAFGRFELACPARRVTLRASYVGFREVEKRVDVTAFAFEELVIRLEPITIELPMAVIRPQGPEVVYERTDLHVGDYLVNDLGVWVLVFEERRLLLRQGLAGQTYWKGARLHLLDTAFAEAMSAALPLDVCELRPDHANRPVVKAPDGAWLVDRLPDSISFRHVDAATYLDGVLPWTDSLPGMLIGNTWMYEYPAFDHVAYDAITDRQELICSVVDRFWMEIFRGSYKYMNGRNKVLAMDLAREHGSEPEIMAGFMTDVSADPRYEPPYAPLYVVDGVLHVFDHHKERIRTFSKQLLPVREVPITYQRERDWDRSVLHDRSADIVYARFSRGQETWLQQLDPLTGELGTITRLTHPWPERVQVHGGHAYYVYRPFGSPQKRTLYREPLR